MDKSAHTYDPVEDSLWNLEKWEYQQELMRLQQLVKTSGQMESLVDRLEAGEIKL